MASSAGIRRLPRGWAGTILAASLIWLGAELWRERPDSIAPYGLPRVSASLQAPIAALEARVQRQPDGALDLAELAGYYLQRARHQGSQADRELAAATAARSLASLPFANPSARLVQAELARDEHDFSRALEICQGVLAEQPGHEPAAALKLACLLELGRAEEGLPRARQLAERRPGAGTCLLYGQVLAASGRAQEARAVFLQGLAWEDVGELDVSARLRLELGRLHAAAEELQLARGYVLSALQIEPGWLPGLADLAELEERLGNHRDAETLLQQAYQASGRPLFLVRQAWLHARLGNRERAAELAAQAERLLPLAHAEAVIELLLLRGDQRSLQQALQLASAEAQARPTRAILRRLERVQAALAHGPSES